MSFGLPWSEEFLKQLGEKEFRDEFVADQVRTRIALMVRALREQEDRQWSQAALGAKAGKPQNVISRIENPDYGQLSLKTLLEIAAAFDLPLLVDIPEWGDWLHRIKSVSKADLARESFDLDRILAPVDAVKEGVATGRILPFKKNDQPPPETAANGTDGEPGALRPAVVAEWA